MKTCITARIETGLALHTLCLYLTAVVGEDSRPDRTPVRLHPFELHFDPVLLRADVISEQRRRFIQVHNQNIDVPVVVEITEGATTAAMRIAYSRASLFHELFKCLVAEVAENRARSLVGILRQLSFDFRVNVPGGHEQVWIAIVVEIDHPRSPTDVARIHCDLRGPRHVIEVSLAVVVIEAVGVIGKMGLEKINMAVEVVVADTDSHASLLHAVVTQRHSAEHAFLPKRSVMVVHEQQAW